MPRCPCRRKTEATTYAKCCAPYHRGITIAATAVVLMRSRYSAFVLADGAYLTATWHPSTRPAELDVSAPQKWLSLQLSDATEDGDRATVSFVARSLVGGRSHVLRETSRFVREAGRWYYVDGQID
jgi:SEC-C motif domain protein